MKGFIGSKLVLTLATLVMLMGTIFIPLSGNIMHSYADSGFSIVPSPSLGGSKLLAATSYGTNNAWAVGFFYTLPYRTLIGHWDGTSWTQQTSANIGTNANYLYGVKALSATNIWAVGAYEDAHHNSYVLIEHSTDGGNTWTQDAGSYQGSGYLSAIDGDPSTGDAWAVGVDGGTALTLRLVNGHFSSQTNVNQNNGMVLSGVSVYSSSDVWAVGTQYIYFQGTNTIVTLTLHYDGSGWTKYPSPNLYQIGENYLNGVTDIGPGNAWAVGYSYYSSVIGTLMHWNGSTWSTTPLTVATGWLNAVAATSSNDIWATGGYFGSGTQYSGVWHSSNGGTTWAQASVESPSSSFDNEFHGLAIDKNTGTIWAVGNYSTSSGENTLIEQYVPSVTPPVTQWQSPQNGFYMQGISVPLSVGITSGASQITGVTFTASWDSNSNVPICNGVLTNGNWVCKWGMKYNGSFVRNGPITFGYTVATTGGNIVNPNSTRSGTIVYELTDKNPKYAGYSATSHNNSVAYSKVVAKWTVPKVVTCGLLEQSESAVWDGLAGNTQLVQIGTESNCNLTFSSYVAVWEVVPSISAQTIPETVSPGDKMIATVEYVASSAAFQLTLEDSGKWLFSTPAVVLTDPSERTHGECIAEDPLNVFTNSLYPLTNFGKVSIDCLVQTHQR